MFGKTSLGLRETGRPRIASVVAGAAILGSAGELTFAFPVGAWLLATSVDATFLRFSVVFPVPLLFCFFRVTVRIELIYADAFFRDLPFILQPTPIEAGCESQRI